MSTPRTVVAALTVHNRKQLTMRCLDALADQQVSEVTLRTVLFDDGSVDGTAEAVAAAHREVTIIRGDGSFYWNGGMRVALAAAMADSPDFLLWLNDDTMLRPAAVQTLIDTHERLHQRGQSPCIVVGTVIDPSTREANYSGVVQDRRRRMWFKLVTTDRDPVRADTMNGNCVLVPRDVYTSVGNLDSGFTHSMGDYDYGLRASQQGVGVWVAPGVLATCPSNPGFVPQGTSVREEFSRLRGTKHLPPDEWVRFVSRWGGPAWPLYWVSPYLRRLIWIVRSRLTAQVRPSAGDRVR